jgi:hypothetical protein
MITKSNILNYLLVFLVVGLFGLHPQTVYAQTQEAPTETVNITTESRFYGPDESVTVNLSSNLINLNNAEVTWSEDGEAVASGVGATEATVTTGSVGETTDVSVRAQIPGQGVVTRSLQLTPVDVDLIWEATDSFTPAFYKGKALHPGWGPVKITVIPHIPRNNGSGDQYTANELVYNWEFNNLAYGDDSGRGQNTFTFDSTPRENRVSVEIETPGGEPVAARSVTVPTTEPQITLYPVSSSRGIILSQVFTESDSSTQRSGISAQPFYYLVDSPQAEKLTYDWRINNQRVEQLSPVNQVSLDNNIFSSGQNSISLEISDNDHLLFPSVSINESISI